MSFRELRNFTEMMRALGYPRLISVDNFRTPNFELVADILYWMVKRYDPDVSISDNIESEGDRVDFLVGVTQAMASKAHIKMNAKKLYSADGFAVKELLKLATVLYQAARADSDAPYSDADAGLEPAPLSSQLSSIKEARALATDITDRGARLFDLLGKEREARRQRVKAAAFLEAAAAAGGSSSGGAEAEYVEGSLREIVACVGDTVTALRRQTEDLAADERALDGKIKKAQADLERNEKRLKSLQTHRPAFADELEKLELELQRYYEVYLERFRNLDYLEHELDEYDAAARAETEEHTRRRARAADKVRKEQLKQFIGREPASEAAIEEELQRGKFGGADGSSRQQSGSSSNNNNAGNSKGSARPGGAFDRGGTPTAANGSTRPGAAAAVKKAGDKGRGKSGASSSGSDLNSERTSTEDEVSLNDSTDASGSLIDDDDESSAGSGASGSASASDDENF